MSQSQFIDLSRQRGLTWHEDFIVHLASIIRPRLYVESEYINAQFLIVSYLLWKD